MIESLNPGRALQVPVNPNLQQRQPPFLLLGRHGGLVD